MNRRQTRGFKLSQQISPSKLRKGFLAIGIVLLVLSFFFFYWASRINWDYVATQNVKVDLLDPGVSGLGSSYPFGYAVYGMIMQPNDVITVSYPEPTQINGTIQITLTNQSSLFGFPTNLTSTDTAFLSYTNPPSNDLHVVVYLIAQNMQNVTITTTTTLNHYETPQWVYFGIGVILSSLALVPIFKSKK